MSRLMKEVILRARSITVTYRGMTSPVLRDVDMDVFSGESLAVVGPSGSGKTTLLSVLGGLVKPDKGEVWRAPIGGNGPFTAWVTQTTNALGHRSVMDNVVLGARVGGYVGRDAARRAREHLDLVGIPEKAAVTARSLSGGELQRMCIARALAMGSAVVLADEPTGQLDDDTSALVISLLVACVRDGAALICVTHDAAVAAACDSVVELTSGHVKGSGE